MTTNTTGWRRSSGPPAADATPTRLPGTRRRWNRLLALEERRALPARPVEHAVPHKVKLPTYWEKDAAAWFRLAEAVMEYNHVVEQRVMYRTVLLHIPHHVLERARGILTVADTAVHPFMELKNRLVELLTPSILDKCTGTLWGAELGGRRPTGGDDGGPAA